MGWLNINGNWIGRNRGGISWSSYWKTQGLAISVLLADQIKLDWVAVPGATGYSVERSTDGVMFAEIEEVGAVLTYTDTSCVRDTNYYYRLRGIAGEYTVYSNIATANTYLTFDKGKIVFTFDDGFLSDYTIVYPLFVSKGITGTFYIYGSAIEGRLTHAQMLEMHLGGMDMQCHVDTTGTEEDVNARYEAVNTEFLAAGVPIPKHTAYSSGLYTEETKPYTKAYRLTGRKTAGYYGIYRDADKYSLACRFISHADTEMAAIKLQIDAAATDKTALTMYAHEVDSTGLTSAQLTELIDYAKGLDVDIISMSELYDLMFTADTPAADMKTLTLTASGTGASYATLGMLQRFDCTVTIDGNGYLYNNTSGEGESQSKYIQNNDSFQLIVKCTSGTCNITLPNSELGQILFFNSSANAPVLGGDISQFTNLTKIKLESYVALSGDITGLSKLTYLEARAATNTFTGSISNMSNLTYLYFNSSGITSGSVTNKPLTYIRVPSTCALSGDITNLIELTYLQVPGANTLSGSITNLIKLTLVQCDVGNTISGSVAGLVDLTYFDVRGSNTLSGSISGLIKLTRIFVTGSNTLSGDIAPLVLCAYIYVVGNGAITYSTKIFPATMSSLYVRNASGSGWNVASLSLAIIEASAPTWTGDKNINLSTYHASMADTSQEGIWGDFDGETSPSALAIAYKTLKVTKTVTVSLTGITAPGATGDGTGFPTGFGDWYRS